MIIASGPNTETKILVADYFAVLLSTGLLQPREKVFEIDTSDQMVILSLWASSIGLHLINIAASDHRRRRRAPKPRGDFLQLTSMTIFYYRRAAEARATIWRRSRGRRHLLAIGTKKSRKKKGESQDIRWHSQALNPLCMFAVTTAGD